MNKKGNYNTKFYPIWILIKDVTLDTTIHNHNGVLCNVFIQNKKIYVNLEHRWNKTNIDKNNWHTRLCLLHQLTYLDWFFQNVAFLWRHYKDTMKHQMQIGHWCPSNIFGNFYMFLVLGKLWVKYRWKTNLWMKNLF